MRIRSTKPEFWRSGRIAAVSWEARLVLKALESFVDDNGVGKDDLELIVGDLFMRDLVREPSRTLARVSEAISELSEAGLVWRYEADETRLLYLSFWESVQRIDKPQTGRFPRPDGTLDYKESEIREPLATPREVSRALAPGTGEQGNRGTGEQSSPSTDAEETDDRFEEFWDTYGKKVGKKAAVAKWRSALKKPDVDADMLIRTAAAYVAGVAAEGKFPTYAKDPERWLLGECWRDERSNVRQLRPGVDDDGTRPEGVPADAVKLPPLPRGFFDQ